MRCVTIDNTRILCCCFFSEITQDIASKGLALVYEICSAEQKDLLVSELVGTLMTGKRRTQDVTADTQVFEEGSMGKTPEGYVQLI